MKTRIGEILIAAIGSGLVSQREGVAIYAAIEAFEVGENAAGDTNRIKYGTVGCESIVDLRKPLP